MAPLDATAGIGLEPERDVARGDGRFHATSDEPWLRLVGPGFDRLAGRLVEIVYRASAWDEPARPVLRLRREDGGVIDHIGAGPVDRAGIWTGRMPRDLSGISISPTNRRGPFDFAIASLRPRSWLALVAVGATRNRRSTRSAILTRLIGWGPESDNNLAWAIGAHPLGGFAAWQARRAGPVALDGIDRPRFTWAEAPPVVIVVRGEPADPDAVRRTCASLAAQVFPHWTALVVGAPAPADPRIAAVTLDQATAMIGDRAEALVGVVPAGATLPPTALATLVEQSHREPRRRLLYGDLVAPDLDGRRQPILLPGWSPRLQAARPYLGPSVFVRGMAAWSLAERAVCLGDGQLPEPFLAGLAADEVQPMRRVTLELAAPFVLSPAPAAPARATLAPDATAAIIIPTRDHPALLRRAIASIRATTSSARRKIVVADNGSVSPEAVAHLTELRSSADVIVTSHPGPFNFSRMCNDAAAAAPADVLVFLNDDTEILGGDWLDRLCAHALDPMTGAVGAKLTYPDGRLQHVGVLLGMGGSAGHFGAPAPGDDPGWAGRNLAVHEVSAVTGACLAVARKKFDTVGGFDAEHLPIELSDIDLCLKLNARGWQTIVDPAVHLMHEESASRGGATLRRLAVHDTERAIFLERWRHVLRDDPTFHPGLSLYSWRAALG